MITERFRELRGYHAGGRRGAHHREARRVSVADINEAIDRSADQAITNTLALELDRLDELQEVFYALALEGDVQCGALVIKILGRWCVMLGLHTPRTAVLQIVAEAAPKETSTDRIEAALNALIADQKKSDPTTH